MKTRGWRFQLIIFTLMVLLGAAACSGTADFDVTGTWEYTMIATDGNTYDTGTITFAGSPTSGSFVELNIYEVEYEGEYRVNGTALTLTGDEQWQGTLESADSMSGTWEHEDGFSGTYTAVRRSP